MRLALLSDIHGNLLALEDVLADMEAHGPFDAIGIAGDLCEWGPQPRAVLERVRALDCPVVQGNTDRNVTLTAEALRALGKTENAIEGLAWTRAQIGADGVSYLAGLPFAWTFAGPQGQDVLMVHANPRDQDTHLPPDAPAEEVAAFLDGTTSAVVAFGHLHIPYVRHVAGRLLVDVASVGFPRDGDTRAAYATLAWDNGWRASIRRVPYDLERAAAAFRASGMPGSARRIAALFRASYSKKDVASGRA
jgi:predicted phosphodiesterase